MKNKTLMKTLSAFLAVVMVLCSAPLSGFVGLKFPEINLPQWNLFDFSVKAEAATYSGSCGDNLNWSLDTETGVLDITGAGAMSNYSYYLDVPWYSYRSYVKTVNIADGVTSIGSSAFENCTSLTSVTIPDSVTSIGSWTFSDCVRLTSITIPDSVTSIGSSAFEYCDNLKDVYYTGDIESWCGINFADILSTPMFYAKKVYIDSTLVEEVVIPEDITSISGWAFYNWSWLKSITIHDDVTSIGIAAFYNTAYYNDSTNWESDALYINNYLIEVASSSGSCEIKNGTTVISDGAFFLCSDLTSITIPDSVVSIGASAFYYCNNLTCVTIPYSVVSIGEYAFCGSGLTSLAIPDSVTSIGKDAFYCSYLVDIYYTGDINNWSRIDFDGFDANPFCNAENLYVNGVLPTEVHLTIPEGVTEISDYAFYNWSWLKSVTIPGSVTSIGKSALESCENLETVFYFGSEESWEKIKIGSNNIPLAFANIVFNVNEIKTNESGYIYIVSDNDVTILSYSGIASNLSIPAEIEGKPVTKIGNNAFNGNTTISNLMIPASVTRIGTDAFYGCYKISNVYYAGDSDGWCSIDFGSATANPLYYATNLYIGGSVLKTLTVGDEITEIKPYAFYNYGKLTEVTTGKNTEKVGVSAFEGCSAVEKLNLSESVTVIGSSAFYNCSALNTVNYGGTLADWILINFENGSSNPASISKALYIDGNKVTGIVIPEGSTEIKPYAFYNYGTLNAFELPDSMETVGNNAFYGCTVSEVEIPVQFIDALPFTGLTKITVTKGSGVMKDFTSSTYQNALWYKNNSTLKTLILEDGIENIGNYAFYNSKFATTSILPESVKKIGDYAFYGCSAIKTIELSDSVEELGSYAFASCANLTSATFGENLKTIGASAFYLCSKLATMDYKGAVADWVSINFADSTANPIYYAKALKINNQKLTKLVVPSGVEKINPYAFYNCTSLKSVHLLDGVKEIGEYAFYGCTGIETVSTFSSLETVGNSAFYNCSALTTITYFGDMMDWFNVNIETNNTAFSDAEVSFVSGQHTHSYEQSVELEATCTSTGVIGYYCACGEGYTEEILALGHTEADAIEENRVQATCTVEGSYDTVVYCSVCNEELLRETTVIPATGHGEKILVSETLPTCEETGVRYYKCAVCGFDGQNKIAYSTSDCPQSSHNYSNNTNITKSFSSPGAIKLILKFSSSTKTESSYDYIYIYNKDGSLYGKYSGTQLSGKTIELQGDSFSIKLTSDSSNVYYGYSFASITAVTSNEIDYSFQEEIPVIDHTPGDWEIKTYPTTTKEGVKIKKCTSCGVEIDRQVMNKLDEVCDYLEWTIANNRAYITGYKTGISGNITIPDEIYGYPVETIEKGAFAGAPITGITLGVNINTIYAEAFVYCSELEFVTIPWGIASISETAFIGCTNLKEIKIFDHYYNEYTNSGLNFKIDDRGVLFSVNNFYGGRVGIFYAPAKAVGKSYEIPKDVEYAHDLAFIDCKDFTLTIPEKFNIEDDSSFWAFLSVNKFFVDESNPYLASVDGVLYNKDVTNLVKYPVDSKREFYSIPETVTSMNSEAFIVMEEEIELIVLYNISYDYKTFVAYKVPENLTVHCSTYSDIVEDLVSGPTSVCVSDITPSQLDEMNERCEELRDFYDETWNEYQYEYTYGSAEYYMVKAVCTGIKDATPCFEDCNNIHEQHTHTPGQAVKENIIEPTCVKSGSYDMVVYCTDCEVEISRETKTISAKGHSYGAWVVTTEPTMIVDGVKTRTCSDCGETETDRVPKTGITVTVTDADGNVIKEEVISGDMTEISFNDITDGEYTVTFEKETYATREYTVTASDGTASLEFKLNKAGDMNGDGKINAIDVARANAHAKGASALSGYDLACVDVNDDGKVNAIDVALINAHSKGVKPLW